MNNDEHNADILCDSLESLRLHNINSFRNTTSSKNRVLCQYDVNDLKRTPDAVFSDCSPWGKHSRIQLMDTGVNYTSCIDLMNQGRVFSSRKLCDTSKKKILKMLF